MYEEAKNIDEEAMTKISPNDKKRIIRVLEIYHKTGKTKTEREKESREKQIKYDYILFAINIEREKARTVQAFKEGSKGKSQSEQALQAQNYLNKKRAMIEHLENKK